MIVCIAEKPSVAAEIAKVVRATVRRDGYFEGNGYQVTWAFGHLCQLKEPGDYHEEWKEWRLDTLPMIPETYDIKPIPDAGSASRTSSTSSPSPTGCSPPITVVPPSLLSRASSVPRQKLTC